MIANDLCQTRKEPITIAVIGAGGTGSQVMQQLGRIHLALRARNRAGLQVMLYDNDDVTEANMARQLFTMSEVGRFKADVLIERMNRFYGTQWLSVPHRIDASQLAIQRVAANIIISCVDNVASRRELHGYVIGTLARSSRLHTAFKSHYWIDTGNSATTGQIILSSEKHKLPTVIDLYPNAEELEDKDQTPSCSLAEALDKQHLFINTIIGQVTAMLVLDICTKPILTWYGAYINLGAAAMIHKRIGHESKDKPPGTTGVSGRRQHKAIKAKKPRQRP